MHHLLNVFSLFLLLHCLYGQSVDVSHSGDEKLELVYSSWEPSDEARKDLPPLIFLHGMIADRMTWNKLAPQFAEATGRKVYALDARNHGNSPRSETHNFNVLADDLDHFMESHNIPKAALVGHSMGGMTAINFALRRGEKVEKFVTEDISSEDVNPEILTMISKYIVIIEKAISYVPSGVDLLTAKKMLVEIMSKLVPPEEGNPKHELDLIHIAIKKENGRYVWKANLEVIKKILKNRDFDQNLKGQYTGDVLFYYGAVSPFHVAKDESHIKKHFPNVQLIAQKGAGHQIHEFFLEDYLKIVTKFINS